MTKRDETKRRGWLGALAKLTAPGDSVRVAEGLASMLPLLGDLGDEVFTSKSLDIVGRASLKRPPNYGELRAHLDAYAETLRPQKSYALVVDPDLAKTAKLEDERKEAAEDWSDARAVMRAAAALEGHPMRRMLGGALAGLVMRHAPENVQYLPPDFLRPPAPKADRFTQPVTVGASACLTPDQLRAAYGNLPNPRPQAPSVDANRGRSLQPTMEAEELYG